VEHSALALPIPVPRPVAFHEARSARRQPEHILLSEDQTIAVPPSAASICKQLLVPRHGVDRTRSVFTSPTLPCSCGLKA
jgi:hypothetical protein